MQLCKRASSAVSGDLASVPHEASQLGSEKLWARPSNSPTFGLSTLPVLVLTGLPHSCMSFCTTLAAVVWALQLMVATWTPCVTQQHQCMPLRTPASSQIHPKACNTGFENVLYCKYGAKKLICSHGRHLGRCCTSHALQLLQH